MPGPQRHHGGDAVVRGEVPRSSFEMNVTPLITRGVDHQDTALPDLEGRLRDITVGMRRGAGAS